VDGGLYVKSMSREGPAYGSGVVRVGDLLLQVGGKTVLSKPVDKVKRLILGASGTSCEFVFKRWTHGGDESVIYSLTMTRRPAANAGEDAPADGAWVLF
jgi:C-terminal processing protease CtpA/Prc